LAHSLGLAKSIVQFGVGLLKGCTVKAGACYGFVAGYMLADLHFLMVSYALL